MGGKMLDLTHELFESHCSTLKETSFDNKNSIYMTESRLPVIHFDKVAGEYSSIRSLSETLQSNDALIPAGNTLTFVEFKNGQIKRGDGFQLRGKNYNSVLILSDLASMSLSDIRSKTSYILVYNKDKNQANTWGDERVRRNQQMQDSPAFTGFVKLLANYAKEEYIRFGLRIFENYCFKEVHTYTQEEFEEFLATLPQT